MNKSELTHATMALQQLAALAAKHLRTEEVAELTAPLEKILNREYDKLREPSNFP